MDTQVEKQPTSLVQFKLLPKDDPIPSGYTLTTCNQAEQHTQDIQTQCSPAQDQIVRLKNGVLSRNKVKNTYRTRTEFKLVSSRGDVGELTIGDVLVALAYAGDHDDPNELEELVRSKDPSILSQKVPSANYCTVVHICACEGSIKTLALLSEKYAKSIRPEELDGDGENALHDLAAASRNVEEAARIILTQCGRGSFQTNSMLSQHNADGYTPLHKAIMRNNNSMCVGLLLHADRSQDSNWLALQTKSETKDTALHLAVKKEYLDVIKALLAFPGVDQNLDLTNKVNERQETPLHVASWLGMAEICAELLRHGAKLNIQDAVGRFPLTNAFRRNNLEALLVLLDSVIDHKSSSNDATYKMGLTPLHIAVAKIPQTYIHTIFLLEAGASVEQKTHDGKTALHIATEQLRRDNNDQSTTNMILNVVENIVDSMTNPDAADRKNWLNMQDHSGQAAIHNLVSATKEFCEEVARIIKDVLIPNGACVDLRNSDGETPLHIAARNGLVDVVELLLTSDCPYNSRGMNRETWITMTDFSGETALHEAARAGEKRIVGLLLDRTTKANASNLLRVRDAESRTALHWAVQNNDVEMVDEMMKHAEASTKFFLMWNACKGSSTVPDVLKKHQHSEHPINEPATLLDELPDLDMATELINSGADVGNLKEETRFWLSQNLCRRASDQPAWEDSLGRKHLVHGIAALLLNPYTAIPITIGIFGAWGTGKSSFMLQVEATLLHMAVKEIFRKKTLQNTSNDPAKKLRSQVNEALQKCMPQIEGSDFIDTFEIRSEYPELLKDLALTDSSKLSPEHVGKRTAISTSLSLKEAVTIGLIPSVLIVRYNAWHYNNKAEACAGLAVEISRELERNMTPPQWLRMYVNYSWRQRRKEILLQLLLPLFVFLMVVSTAVSLWEVAPIKREYKLLGLPIGILGVLWLILSNFFRIFQPIAETIQQCVQSPNHTSTLGYQQRVIDDIKFLKDELCTAPSAVWKLPCIFSWLFFSSNYYMKGTRLRKQYPRNDNLRIVVFIDDLDRCEEKTVVEILSAINLILAVCDINVVLGVDREMVEHAIRTEFSQGTDVAEKYHDTNEVAEKYLQKIIQLHVQMPDPSEKDMKNFLKRQIGRNVEKNAVKQQGDEGSSAQGERIQEVANEDDDGDQRQEMRLEMHRLDENSRSQSLTIQHGIHGSLSLATKCCSKGPNCVHTRKEVCSNEGQSYSLLANYSPMETDMLLSLCQLAMGDKRFPREWKRFLNYHRLAWSIISLDTDMKEAKFKGWQRKLILWIFICWNWREQMDEIIENWYEILAERQKMQKNESVEDDESDEDEQVLPSDGSAEDNEHLGSDNDIASAYMKRKVKKQEKCSLGDIIQAHREAFSKNEDDTNGSTKERVGHPNVENKKKWNSLSKILNSEYDIKFDFIEKFQHFRFFCKLKYLEGESSM